MSSFGKGEYNGPKNYPFQQTEIEPSAKIPEIQKTCPYCKKVPCTKNQAKIDSCIDNSCISYSNNTVHHHYENCMIEVKNSIDATTPSDSVPWNYCIVDFVYIAKKSMHIANIFRSYDIYSQF